MRAVNMNYNKVVNIFINGGYSKYDIQYMFNEDDPSNIETLLMGSFVLLSDHPSLVDGSEVSEKMVRMARLLLGKRPALLHITIAAMSSNPEYARPALPYNTEAFFISPSYQWHRKKLEAYRQALFTIFLAAARFKPWLPTDVWMEDILPCIGPF